MQNGFDCENYIQMTSFVKSNDIVMWSFWCWWFTSFVFLFCLPVKRGNEMKGKNHYHHVLIKQRGEKCGNMYAFEFVLIIAVDSKSGRVTKRNNVTQWLYNTTFKPPCASVSVSVSVYMYAYNESDIKYYIHQSKFNIIHSCHTTHTYTHTRIKWIKWRLMA